MSFVQNANEINESPIPTSWKLDKSQNIFVFETKNLIKRSFSFCIKKCNFMVGNYFHRIDARRVNRVWLSNQRIR